MQAQLIQVIDGKIIEGARVDIENIIPAFEIRGYLQAGTQEDNKGSIKLHGELIGAPKFKGLCGPMYNGPDLIRYETWEAYDRLST